MNELSERLALALNGFNKVTEVIIDPDKQVKKDIVWNIIEEIYYQNYNKLANYTSYFTLQFMFNDTIDRIGLEWSNRQGKFTKRLLKNMPLLTPFAGIIGDQITRKAYHPNGRTWLLSLSEQIFWQDGNFGKDNSCWWGGYEESKDVFIDNGGLGLLWHKDEDPDNGIGRVWIAPITEYIRPFGYQPILALFNQYGEDQTGTPLKIDDTARMINTILPETNYIHADLINDYNDDIPYINGNHAVMVKSNTVQINSYSIHLEWGDDNSFQCQECSERLADEECYYDDQGNIYCEDCYNENFTRCHCCDNEVYRGDAYTDYNGYDICYRCYDRYYFTCDGCSEVYPQEDAISTEDGTYCESCAPEEEPEEEQPLFD